MSSLIHEKICILLDFFNKTSFPRCASNEKESKWNDTYYLAALLKNYKNVKMLQNKLNSVLDAQLSLHFDGRVAYYVLDVFPKIKVSHRRCCPFCQHQIRNGLSVWFGATKKTFCIQLAASIRHFLTKTKCLKCVVTTTQFSPQISR